MKQETLGATIAALRKRQGMTQLELAQQLGVTDKAVSKWERDLSCPDIGSLPRLAQLLGVSVDELMQCRTEKSSRETPARAIFALCLKAIPLAMGAAVTVLSALGQLTAEACLPLLGLGLFCLALGQLEK